MFADMLEEMQALQTRARPLIDEYEKLVREEQSLQVHTHRHTQTHTHRHTHTHTHTHACTP